ncbi:hypothetical protein Tco_1441519, partial [Tanacetum coccineum]
NIRVNSFTMKMEILLEPTSNKLMVEHAEYDESNTYVLERFNTTAGNPVKKILLKLNLSDHRSLGNSKLSQGNLERRARVLYLDSEEDLEDLQTGGGDYEIDKTTDLSLRKIEGTFHGFKSSWRFRAKDLVVKKKLVLLTYHVTTASVTPEVSTAAANLVYIRRSAEKRKDKGKAIIKEDESVQKKTKKKLEQERLGHKEAIRLQEHINEEENQRIAKDAEIAKQLQEEFDRARQEQEVIAKADQA